MDDKTYDLRRANELEADAKQYRFLADELDGVARKLREKYDPPCSGPGYAHKAHGNCPGYTYDRT